MHGSSSNIPAVQRAILQGPAGQPTIVDNVPVPDLHPGTILVKTAAVSLNPVDYKMGRAFPSPGAVVGTDFVGQIVDMMAAKDCEGSTLRVGDMVCGSVHGSNPDDHTTGSFAQYVLAPADLVLRVPDGFPLDRAATLGTPVLTSCMSLWISLAITALPESPVTDAAPVLVYGGSTACGTMAIQLLKM